MELLNFVNKTLAVLTIFSQIFILLVVIYFLFFSKKFEKFLRFLKNNAVGISFIVALIATLGSLYYSIIAGFTPCELCWYQRIFMYPAVIILGIGILKKDGIRATIYTLPLSIIGFIISAYHNYILMAPAIENTCTATSCTTKFIMEFNYVTIPSMALTAFSLIIMFLIIKKYVKHENT